MKAGGEEGGEEGGGIEHDREARRVLLEAKIVMPPCYSESSYCSLLTAASITEYYCLLLRYMLRTTAASAAPATE